MLSTTLAKNIIYEVGKLFEKDLIIVNVDGEIIASSEEGRIGDYHEGALLCAQKSEKVIIKERDVPYLNGVKAGINFPILFQGKVIGVIGITGEPNQIMPFGELLQKMTELMIKESYYSEESQWRARMIESFVLDWIQEKEWTAEFVERARLLSIDLKLERLPILIEWDQLSPFIFNAIGQIKHVWEDPQKQELMIQWGSHRFLLLHHEQTSQKTSLVRKLNQLKTFIETTWGVSVRVGVGNKVAPIKLGMGVTDAEKALLATSERTPIVFEEDLRLELCLQEIKQSTKQEYMSRILNPLLAQDELLTTLKMLFTQHLSLKQTAEKLHIHINTLYYRMKKIEEYTKLDVKSVPEAFQLYLALHFLEEHTKKSEKKEK